ncbi:selenide, water dikinase SelD [Halioglobus maricola]|uniref:Selenide, water dikinase SelD n=1 Tax=Halioglobus maricola TaxID=2601894 RepID=A0A5P9NP20_9GAMM|nr:selenide, water dikinase SelD [Halioglobus maricola]QFU77580.1 selenide, water dikinase SelD [Halioglobus maricola]
MRAQPELVSDLVFVGGGHAHALALRMLAMKPVAGLRITLISPSSHTPYSGMLPGLVAGHYTFEDAHIDLARLCQWAGVRFLEAEVTGLDPRNKILQLAGRPSVHYDLLSIDIGSQPELDSVPGARAFSVPVKPVAGLWRRWRELEDQLTAHSQMPRVAVVGGGAGSVELVLAMAHTLADKHVQFDLICGGDQILQGYNRGARAAAERALQDLNVNVQLSSRVDRVEEDALLLADGRRHPYDKLFWCTGAAAAPWVAASGLACDERGFLKINNALQSVDDPDVFAAGDIATQVEHPRPKAGVYAVRQGPVLAANLHASLMGSALREHRPQHRFLSLVSLGDRKAAADRGPFFASGEWVWRWKDRIDREFMGRFEALPAMPSGDPAQALPGALDPERKPHCGGCGAKVGARGLAATLSKLTLEFPGHSVPTGDDAAAIPAQGDQPLVQSIDLLRQMVSDPWLMGRIAANHALSDLYACGARPISALAAMTLPFARSSLLQRELEQILGGALHEFSRVDCLLSGGHSMQGSELQLGFTVNGQPMDPSRGLLPKRGVQPGDELVLTKPLGTGVLFAAQMSLLADGRQIRGAIDMMLQGNGRAAELALAHGARACTDITGFGLLGHLLEMLDETVSAQLCAEHVPSLPGARDHLAGGVRSSMHAANAEMMTAEVLPDPAAKRADGVSLLLDPQTSGGLLVALPAERAEAYCHSLHEAGYTQAIAIGKIEARGAASIRLS